MCVVLLQHDAEPTIRNTDGRTALDLADASAKAVLTGELDLTGTFAGVRAHLFVTKFGRGPRLDKFCDHERVSIITLPAHHVLSSDFSPSHSSANTHETVNLSFMVFIWFHAVMWFCFLVFVIFLNMLFVVLIDFCF